MQYWTMFEALCLICFLLCSISEAIAFNTIGVMRPRDPYLFVGENITLFCNLTNSEMDADSSRLFFTRMGERIAEEYMSTVSSRSLRLNYPATIKDEGMFACYLNSPGQTLIVDAQYVKIDYQPASVKNVTCEVLNWSNMTCRWKLGPDYTHMKDINVSLVWTISGVQRDCPKLNNTSCFWSGEYPTGPSSADVFLPDNEYIMTVVVTNTKRNVHAKSLRPFRIDTRKLVKPDPAQSFRAAEKNATCMKLAWNHSEKVRNKIAQVEYFDEWTHNKRWKSVSRGFKQGEVDQTICDLTPFTDHTIRIGIWPEGPDGKRTGFRSDFVYRTERTEASVPEVGPETCIGCFTAVPPEYQDQRNVLIYWKHIPPKLRYSIIVKYSICNPDSTVDNTHNSCSVTDANTTSWLLVLQKTQQYTLQLYAMTHEKKWSGNFSTITIPSQDALPDAPSFFVVERDRQWNAGGGTFYLRWEQAEETLRYLVVWCDGSRTSLKCDNEPQWDTVFGDSTHYNLSVKGGDPKQYLVGVTRQVMRNDSVVGSGIVWARCIYIRKEAPNPPKTVAFVTNPSGESLWVKWSKQECDEIYISHYVVYYCKVGENGNCTGEQKELNVTDNTSAEIVNLEAGAYYSVRVSAVSEWGEGAPSVSITSLVSSSQHGTNATTTSHFTIVGVILGVMVLLILVLIGICKIRRHYLKTREKVGNGPLRTHERSSEKEQSKMQKRPLPARPIDKTATASGTNSASTGYASDMSHSGASNAQCKRSGKHQSITSETSLLGNEEIDDSRRRHRSGNSSTSERTKLLANEAREYPEKGVSKCDSDSGAESLCSSDHDYASVDSGGASSENCETSPGPPLPQAGAAAPACGNGRPGDSYKPVKEALKHCPPQQQQIDYLKFTAAQQCPSLPTTQITAGHCARALSGHAVSATPARPAARFDDSTLQVRPVRVKSGYLQNANDPTLTTASRGTVPSVPSNAPRQSHSSMPAGNVEAGPFSSDYTPDTQTLSSHGNIVTKPFSSGCIPTAELGSLPPLNGPNPIAPDFIQNVGSFPSTNIGPKSAGSGYIQETELRALPALRSMKAQSAYPVTYLSCTPSSSLAAETMNLINSYVHAEIGPVHSSSGSMYKAVNSQANKEAAVLPMKNMCSPNPAPTVKGYAPHSMFQMNGTTGNRAGGIADTSSVYRTQQSEPIYSPPWESNELMSQISKQADNRPLSKYMLDLPDNYFDPALHDKAGPTTEL